MYFEVISKDEDNRLIRIELNKSDIKYLLEERFMQAFDLYNEIIIEVKEK
jgi:hypothetical protein